MLQIQKRNQNWLPSIFDEFFYGDDFQNQFSHRPSMNIIENDKEFKIQIAAAGFAKEEASISLNNDQLQISLLHKEEKENSDKYLRHEFVKRSYKQSFVLPDEVDREKVKASLENGILSITLPKFEPKPEEKVVRQIAIC